MTDRAWAGYKYFSFSGEESKLSIKVRGTGSGTVKVFTDWNGDAVCKIPVRPSGVFQEFTGRFSVPAGTHPLYFVYEGGNRIDFSEFTIQ